jgi:alcohol dehydrogenase (cytochrome c)
MKSFLLTLVAGAALTGAVGAGQAPSTSPAVSPSGSPAASYDLIGVTPAALRAPLSDSWPSYSGDYSGRRYSTLAQVNRSNVKHLALVWTR